MVIPPEDLKTETKTSKAWDSKRDLDGETRLVCHYNVTFYSACITL